MSANHRPPLLRLVRSMGVFQLACLRLTLGCFDDLLTVPYRTARTSHVSAIAVQPIQTALVETQPSPSNESVGSTNAGASSGGVFGRFLSSLRPPLNRTYTAQAGSIRKSTRPGSSRSSKRRNSSPARPPSSRSNGSSSALNSPHITPPAVASSSIAAAFPSPNAQGNSSSTQVSGDPAVRSFPMSSSNAGSTTASSSMTLPIRPQPERRQSSSRRLAAAIARPLFRRSSSQAGATGEGGSTAAGQSSASSIATAKQRGPSSITSGPPSPGPSNIGQPGSRRPFTSGSSRSAYSYAAQSTPSPGAETLHQSAFPSPFFTQVTPTTSFPNPFSPPIDCIPALNALIAQPISSTLSHLIPLNLITQASGFSQHYPGAGSLAAASSISVATSNLSEAPSSSSTHHTAPSSDRTHASSQYPSSTAYSNPGTIGTSAFVSSEQLAASSLSLPTTSIGTVWRMTRALEWVAEHGSTLNALVASRTNPLTPRPSSNRPSMDESRRENDASATGTSTFDFSALLQSVMDAVASIAAEGGVELAYFHGSTPPDAKPSGQVYNYVVSDVQEAFVQGDERGLGIGLLAVLKQVLAETSSGASLEIGFSFALTTPPKSHTSQHPLSQANSSDDDEEDEDEEPPLGTYLLNVEITHTFGSVKSQGQVGSDEPAKPKLDSTVSAALLQHLRLSLITMPPKSDGQVYKLSCTLPQARTPGQTATAQDPSARRRRLSESKEPTLPDLMRFAETSLRGKKAAFHASESSDFAQHVSHHLVLWGVEVNHFSLPTEDESEQQHGAAWEGAAKNRLTALRPEEHGHLGRYDSGFGGSDSQSPPNLAGLASPAVNFTADPLGSFGTGSSPVGPRLESSYPSSVVNSPPLDPSLNFIIIDDDISILKRQLTTVRNNAPTVQLHNALLAKRPQLQSRRTRSSQAIQRPGQAQVSIIHFTSLSRYRQIKEVVHSILKNASPMFPLPEVLVIPKPVGPRRLLATLFNAVKKPALDPYYLPIATSPASPGGHYFFTGGRPSPAPSASNANDFDTAAGQALSALSRMQVADASLPAPQHPATSEPRTPPGFTTASQSSHPPSPVSPDALEYFSRSAAEFGSNASQGIIIQSPDGRPTGLFFQPRAASLYERAESLRMARGSVSDGEKTSSNSSKGMPKGSPSLGGGGQTTVTAGGTELPSIVIPDNMDMAGKSFTVSPSAIAGQEHTSFGQRLESLIGPTQSNDNNQKAAASASSSMLASEDTSASTDSIAQQSHKQASGDLAPAKTPSQPSSPKTPVSPMTTRPTMLRQPTTAVSPPRNEANQGLVAPASPAVSPVSPKDQLSKVVAPPLARAKTERKSSGRGEKSKKSRRPTGTVVPPINVLIVEDNPINQIILSTFLKRKGVKYSVANNGQEAVDKWKTGDFHLVLMDIQLPVKDGIEATQEIRAMERASSGQGYIGTPMPRGESTTPFATPSASAATSPFELPVIIVALTASSLQSDRVNALAAGCNDFLTKPVSLQWLNQKIVEWGSMAYLSGFSRKRKSTLMSPITSTMSDAALSQQLSPAKKTDFQTELAKVKEETEEKKEEKKEIIEEKQGQAAEQQEDAETFDREAQAIEKGELPTDVTEDV